MPPAATALGIHYFGPPYERLRERVEDRWPDVARLRGQCVVWLTGDASAQQQELDELRVRPPLLPLIVLLPPPEEIAPVVPVLAALPALAPRTVLPYAALDSAARLRAVLSMRPRSVPDAVVRNLERRGMLRTDRLRAEVRRIFEVAPDVSSISQLCRRMYMSRRTLGRHFGLAGLPVPSHWLQIARLIYVTTHLQAETGPIFRIATRLCYPDGFTMSNQMYRLTGARPSEVRRLLGWEWVLDAWLRRERARGLVDGTRYVL